MCLPFLDFDFDRLIRLAIIILTTLITTATTVTTAVTPTVTKVAFLFPVVSLSFIALKTLFIIIINTSAAIDASPSLVVISAPSLPAFIIAIIYALVVMEKVFMVIVNAFSLVKRGFLGNSSSYSFAFSYYTCHCYSPFNSQTFGIISCIFSFGSTSGTSFKAPSKKTTTAFT